MRLRQGPQETDEPGGMKNWESLERLWKRPAHRIRLREELDLRAIPVQALLIPQGALSKTLEGCLEQRDRGIAMVTGC